MIAVPTFNGRAYNISSTSVNFASSLAAARQASYENNTGYLATVTSANENRFLSVAFSGNSPWIAGQEVTRDDNWRWMAGPEQGDAFAYSAWNPGENVTNTLQDCAYLSNGGWNDQICTSTLPYLTEFCTIVGNTTKSCARKYGEWLVDYFMLMFCMCSCSI